MAKQNFDIVVKVDDLTKGAFKRFADEIARVKAEAKAAGTGMGTLEVNAGKAARAMAGMISSAIGFAGIAGIAASARQVASQFLEAREAAVQFQTDLKELASLGTNASNFGGIRQQVLDLSNALGRSRKDVADALFFIQGGTAGMAAEAVKAIQDATFRVGQLSNAPLDEIGVGLMKTYQLFGHELRDVDEAADKLFATMERGFLTFGQLGNLITRPLAVGEAFKFRLDEILGAVSMGTRIGGKTEEVFTAIRNIILRLPNAAKEGLNLTGDFVDQLKQLENIDPRTLADIFGDRTVALLLSMTKRTEELRKEIELFGNVGGTVAGKIENMFKDAGHASAEMAKSLKQALDNIQASMGANPQVAAFLTGTQAAKLAMKSNVEGQVVPDFAANAAAAIEQAAGGRFATEGLIEQARKTFDAGNVELAEQFTKQAQEQLSAGRNKVRQGIVKTVGGPLIGGALALPDELAATFQTQIDAIKRHVETARAEAADKREKEIEDASLTRRNKERLRDDALLHGFDIVRGVEGENFRNLDEDEYRAIEKAAADPQELDRIFRRIAAARAAGQTYAQLDDQVTGLRDIAGSFVTSLLGPIGKDGKRSGPGMGTLGAALAGMFPKQPGLLAQLAGEKPKESTLGPILKNAFTDALESTVGKGNTNFLTGLLSIKGQDDEARRKQKREAIDADLDNFFGFEKDIRDRQATGTTLVSRRFQALAERQRRGASPEVEKLNSIDKELKHHTSGLKLIAEALKAGYKINVINALA